MRPWQGGILIVGAVLLNFSLPSATLAQDQVAAQLADRDFLFEVVRHLYRWYLDEQDVDASVRRDELLFWVREVHPPLDAGDESRFGEIVLPELNIGASVKYADYTIPELNVAVKSNGFKITNVARVQSPAERPAGFTEVRARYTEVRDYAHRNRNKVVFPAGELLMRMRIAGRAQLAKHPRYAELAARTDKNVVHLAPLSPVANEMWVFWEAGRMLIRFASDMDLENPALWEHDELAVDLYDLDQQVVVSLDEVAGSNAYLTRDQVGRALFNCIVLGTRLELNPDEVPASQPDAPQPHPRDTVP